MDGYHCSTTCPKLSGAVQTRYSDSPKRTQMLSNTRQPSDEAVVRAQPDVTDCGQATRRWVLAAAILGSSITFIDGTVVNVVLPVLQSELRASVAEAQWSIESYGLLIAALLLIAWGRVPESRNEITKGRVDWRGATLAIIGLGGIVFGLIESSARGLTAPLVNASIIIGLAALAGFVFAEARHEEPMMPLRLFLSPTFAGATSLTLCLYASRGGLL